MRSGLAALTIAFWAGLAGATVAQPGPGGGEATVGLATALGSDTLLIGETTFRLQGIDGIEAHQSCFVDGRPWACGAPAIRSLQTLVNGVEVRCVHSGLDDRGRPLAACAAGGLDIAGIMVSDGWALAQEGGPFEELEAGARAARRGVWQAQFVEPADYRKDIEALEALYRRQVVDALEVEVTRAMTDEDSWIYVLDGFEMGAAPKGAELVSLTTPVPHLAPGFVEGSVEERGVFSWPGVARLVSSWMESAVAEVKADAVDVLWAELQSRPSKTVAVFDALGYTLAMKEHAAAWLAEGRQPVLLITSPLVPGWVREWFGDEPPSGMIVGRKSRITAPAYVGTVDGIDIYVGNVPEDVSALLPDDLMRAVYYQADANGDMFRAEMQADATMLAISYATGFAWRDDEIVWIKYPSSEAEVLHER